MVLTTSPPTSDVFSERYLESEIHPGVRYHIKKPIGAGSTGTAYFALRESEQGSLPVVLKVISPEVVSSNQEAATLMVKKEAVALGRIGERVPPTPFVVKLIEAGFIPNVTGARGQPIRVPWVAVEYVHGGLDGTTLEERVCHSVDHSGHAFDIQRALNVVRCMGEGLSAIHEAGVVHRDVTPRNVLCCGFGEDELFKIADLGLARPQGMKGTFNATVLGTPGYAAPEQALPGSKEVTVLSDVFSAAAVIFYVLAGENYFDTESLATAVLSAKSGPRPRLVDCEFLHPELRAQAALCADLDAVIEQATALEMAERPRSAHVLCASVIGLLDTQPKSSRSPNWGARPASAFPFPLKASTAEWQVRESPDARRLVYHAKWSCDGRCLAITSHGVEYWDGQWKQPELPEQLRGAPLCFTELSRPGEWLLGGEEGQLAVFTGKSYSMIEPGAPRLRYLRGCGEPEDLAVFVAQTGDGPPMLCSLVGRRWLKPKPLDPNWIINGLARVSDDTWLVVGRNASGRGFATLYDPLLWELTPIAEVERPLLACDALPTLGRSVAVGMDGVVVWIEGIQATLRRVADAPPLSSVALDASGRALAGSAGKLWEAPESAADFKLAWEKSAWQLPFVSLLSDVGLSYALTPDGAVLECRQQFERK